MVTFTPVFIIESLVNNTSSNLKLTITSLGNPTDPISYKTFVLAHQSILCNLGFGPQAFKEYSPATGYLITYTSDESINEIRVQYKEAEDPLLTIPITHAYKFREFAHLYSWSLYCNNTKQATFANGEHKRKRYTLIIGNMCEIAAKTL